MTTEAPLSPDPVAVAASAPLLEMRGITKRFPGVQALTSVDIALRAGEVVAIIGENGAGKSTLMKVLGGIHHPDEGAVLLSGNETHFHSVHDSLAAGVSIIHQELVLCDNLDIAGNIFLGREAVSNRWLRTLDRHEMNRLTAELLHRVGLDRAPTTPMTQLSIAEQQLVEIAKAISRDARIVVMDEPTSSLTVRETEMLFKVIEDLRSQGIGVLYISHRLQEIIRIADRVVALRDGRRVGELMRGEVTEDAMIRLMIGRDITEFFPDANRKASDVLLRVNGLRHARLRQPISFELKAGEILGFAGLVGAGRTETMRALFGIDPVLDGTIEINGSPVEITGVPSAIAAGLAMVPEDRKLQGLILEMTIEQNISLAGLRQFSAWGVMKRALHRMIAEEQRESLHIKTPSIHQQALNLSGGNQQKVVLGKWLALKPKILILDEPTRGIDVNSKTEIYQLMRALADRGMGILMVSSDMEEILGVSDRIIVMHEGYVSGELPKEKFSEKAVMLLAAGKNNGANPQ